MNPRRGKKIVLLGLMSKTPVAGVVWQTVHYLLGFQRLGYDVYYVEAHARTPSMLMQREDDDSSGMAASFIAAVMRRFDLGDRWAYHALHADGRCYGLSEDQLKHLYRSAALLINLHGGTVPLPEHSATGRLVYLETDPVAPQIELHDNLQWTVDFLEQHCAFFTFGENYGNPDCKLPVSERFDFRPTRQPVVLDLWRPYGEDEGRAFTTIGNWRQPWREVRFRGEIYHWSKHYEFLKFIDLPRRTDQPFELALSGYDDGDKIMLESQGWRVRRALDFSADPDAYRRYIAESRGEFTVAKDQNVRLRSGWFSDRSATYLAAGRPVVTQETGFSNILPTGEGLFAFSTMEQITEAIESINANYERHCRAASDVAREYFGYDVVLSRLLADLGFSHSAAKLRGEPGVKIDNDMTEYKLAQREESFADPDGALPEAKRNTRTGPDGASVEGQQSPRCSIIIPVHNRVSLTRRCLDALLGDPRGGIDVEIVVVDDASTDSTRQLLVGYGERIRVVKHTTNTGFAAACNDGAGAASGEYLVFLNNDVVPETGWLDALVRYAESHPNAAVVGSKLLFPNDAIQHAGVAICQDLYPRHLYAGFPADHPAVNKSRRFQVVSAASILVRREPFVQVGGFDTAFRNGFEDVDFCLRLGERGYEVHYCHESVLYHLESVSEGRFEKDKDNLRLYLARWAYRLWPDDLQYYLEDGLLNVNYERVYPARLAVSPLLATVEGDEHDRQVDRLLNVRSQQVFELLKEVIRLTLRAGEAGWGSTGAEHAELQRRILEPTDEKKVADRGEITGLRPVVPEQAEHLEVLPAEDEPMTIREAELRAMLVGAHEQLLRRDREIESAIFDLQTVLAAEPQQGTPDAPATSAIDRHSLPGKYVGYQRLVRRIREVVRGALPPGTTVVVVSKGDDELLELEDGRRGWHFPQNEEGAYAGYYPADSARAISHLEELRDKGAEYLLFPETAFWWLEHYEELKQYLEHYCQLALRQEEVCMIFELREPETHRRDTVVRASGARKLPRQEASA